ncbi:lactonase family protein [Opitutus sp. GAS368]|jgi:6-phosphogluconolactonase|uniref:lactonase family protein n=1 Tax=Opitutus sp. GAS368 TaxID=1882749 RepID=UPI00087CD184|nr:lactonase family protein [Opitutus sp. GAS368]SDR76585.1 6-phosphogluconolactonase [Opitutus sp. GAS368]
MPSLRRVLLTFTLTLTSTMSAASQLIFLGTYTPKDGASKGIYAVRLDSVTGALSEPVVAAETPNPTFLTWRPDHRVLYALGEGPGPDGQTSAGVAAFAFDGTTQKLALLNRRGAGGSGGTTMLATDATGKMLVTVSYGGGYLASFPLAADGRLGARTSLIAHAGPPGPNKVRQDKPHPHSVTISPDNRFAFIADLGLDRVFAYQLDPATATLTPHDPAFITTPPGTGPRHTKFSRDGRFFYILNEIDGSISVCTYDAARGAGTPIQHISTLPAGFQVTDPDRAAEIRIHPNGRFVYASNRGHESIAVFAVQADGTLKLVEITPCGGKHPRNFELSPDGRWLVCANMNSNNLVSFKVDAGTGRLTSTGSTVTVPQPVCVLFAP